MKSHKRKRRRDSTLGYVRCGTLAERTGANIRSDIACVGSFLIPTLRCIMRQASFSNGESLGFEAKFCRVNKSKKNCKQIMSAKVKSTAGHQPQNKDNNRSNGSNVLSSEKLSLKSCSSVYQSRCIQTGITIENHHRQEFYRAEVVRSRESFDLWRDGNVKNA